MLERVDRVQLAVKDRQAAARTFGNILGAEPVGESDSAHLGARRTVLALGESELELCEPVGPGPAREHLERWGEGLMTAGFSVADVPALRRRLASQGARFAEDGEQTYVAATETAGMPVVITPARARRRVGLATHLYEVTNTIVSDWRAASLRYTRLFGLDPARFSPIKSERFGYVGTLALFDPPARLDRIEISQVVDPMSAMGRWVARRGDSLYMCYVETDDVPAIIARVSARGGRFTPRGADAASERDGLWIHPSALCGLLLGVSRTTVAWEWSGRPELMASPHPPG
jgi:catechol 2,3-dioxygenase-like lactoylglutathione lyase family enzyme